MQDPNLGFLRKNRLILLGIAMVLPMVFLYYKFTHLPESSKAEALVSTTKNALPFTFETVEISTMLALPGTTRDIILNTQGDLAYVAAFGQGIHILSLTDPLNPIRLSSFKHSPKYDGIVKLALSKDEKTLYALDIKKGLYSVDVQNPNKPRLISFVSLRGGTNLTLSSNNNRVYVSATFGVAVVRITPSRTLALLGRLHYLPDRKVYIMDKYQPNIQYARFEEIADVVEVDETTLYLMSKHPDVVDVRDLSAIKIVSHFSTLGNAQQVTVSENRQRMYISSGHSGIEIFGIADQAHPKPLGGHNSEGLALHSTLSKEGNILFVSSLNRGLELFDITYPYDPKLLKRVDKEHDTKKGQVHGSAISADGKVLYVAYGVIGLGVMDLR